MLDKNEKLVTSVGTKKYEFNIKNFFNKVDRVINSKKTSISEVDDKGNIYIEPSQQLETGLSVNNQIILGYSEELESPKKYNNSIIRKIIKKDIFQENNFTNRKQKFTVKRVESISAETNFTVEEVGSDQEKNLKLNNEYNDLNIKDDSFEDNKIDKLVNGKLLEHQDLNELAKDYTNQDDTNKVILEDENSFEEGLKSRLSLMAEKKLTEFGLTPEEKINKCNEYYMNVLYPLFTDLEEGLSSYNRKANVNINTFMISLDVRYQDKIEYKYQVTILDPDNYPILEIMKSDLSGEITIKTELTNTSIDKVSHQDIFHDFLSSYKKHISQITDK